MKPRCEKCVNYEPIVIGINYTQFHNFCIERQCHVEPATDACKYFSERNETGGADNEDES